MLPPGATAQPALRFEKQRSKVVLLAVPSGGHAGESTADDDDVIVGLRCAFDLRATGSLRGARRGGEEREPPARHGRSAREEISPGHLFS